MAKKHYHVIWKQQADIKALLRGAVTAYLLYLAWKLEVSSDPGFSPAARIAAGGLFAVCAVIFGWFTWRQYRAALKGAVLTPEEEAALRQEQEEDP